MNDSPPAGCFDPVPAVFYSPNRTLANRSPKITGWTRFCERDVRVMSGMTREANIQQRQEAAGLQIFRIRRDDVTETMTHEMGMVWRTRRYAVTGIGYPNLAEIELYTIPTTEAYEPAS